MKHINYSCGLVVLLYAQLNFTQLKGDILFSQKYTVCHTVGKGKLTGADLANVQNRGAEEWIIKSMIAYITTDSPDASNPNIKTPSQIFNASEEAYLLTK